LVESRRTQQQRAKRQKGLREGVKTSHRKTTFSFVLPDDFSITSWRFEVPGFKK
jgi:hypothetical protein